MTAGTWNPRFANPRLLSDYTLSVPGASRLDHLPQAGLWDATLDTKELRPQVLAWKQNLLKADRALSEQE
jgi:hypothetical protein